MIKQTKDSFYQLFMIMFRRWRVEEEEEEYITLIRSKHGSLQKNFLTKSKGKYKS